MSLKLFTAWVIVATFSAVILYIMPWQLMVVMLATGAVFWAIKTLIEGYD